MKSVSLGFLTSLATTRDVSFIKIKLFKNFSIINIAVNGDRGDR